MRTWFASGAVLTFSALILSSGRASADGGSPSCSTAITRENVVRCALDASASLRADREGVSAAHGRRAAAAPWFPSNPTISIAGASRAGTEGRGGTLNYSASLAQEIEVAGQRASRRHAADAEVGARSQDVIAHSRQVAARALTTWFESIAAHESLAVAQRLEATGRQIATITRARADAGVISLLDAEVADATSLRITQARLATDRAARTADATLASLLGRDPISGSVPATGTLEPLAVAESIATNARANANASAATKERPELRALNLEAHAFELRAQGYRRARFPTLTLQVFAQNDGYNERVFGAGVSLPIPLPSPVGRVYSGEIAENESLARQRSAQVDATTRAIEVDLATALISYETHRAEAQLYTSARVTKAEQILSEIGKEIEAGRLPIRDAILAEQQLIDVLRGYVETRRTLCIASVDLALASGSTALESAR